MTKFYAESAINERRVQIKLVSDGTSLKKGCVKILKKCILGLGLFACSCGLSVGAGMVEFDRPDFASLQKAENPNASAGEEPVDKTGLPSDAEKVESKSSEAEAPAEDKGQSDEQVRSDLEDKLRNSKKAADRRYIGRVKSVKPELSADKMDYTDKNGALVAKGNATIVDKNFTIESDSVHFSQKEGKARVLGDVKISQQNARMVASSAEVNINTGAVSSDKILFGTNPVYSEVIGMSGDKNKISAGRTRVYFGEPDEFSMNVNSSAMSYTSADDYIQFDDVVMKVGPVPFFYLPSYGQHGLDKPPFDVEIQPGYNNSYGAFIRNTVHYTALENLEPGVLLDYYWKRSVLFGPALDYDYSGAFGDITGSWQGAFINDHGSKELRGLDDLGRQIGSDRFFIQGRHQQFFGENLELTGVLNYWSDQFMTREFRPSLFYDDQMPDNFAEAVYYGEFYSISAFARFQPNDWQIVQQRLPEVRFDMMANDPLGVNLYQEGYAAVGYYKQNSLWGYADNGDIVDYADYYKTLRADAYYGLRRPIQLTSWSTFTPVIGGRVTYYKDTIKGDDNYVRFLGQIGFDAQMDIWGTFDYESKTMGIDGLRHNLRPIMQYRYIPNASQGRDRLPQIDTYTFQSFPSVLDLGQMRNTDYLANTNTLRVGIENIFETRDTEYGGSRKIGRLDFYQDINFDRQPYFVPDPSKSAYVLANRERSFSDFFVNAEISPARWLDVGAWTRVDVNYIDVPEVNSYITLHDADNLKLTLYSTYLEEIINQYGAQLEYKISEKYKLIGDWHYDYKIGKMTYQSYSLWTRPANSWVIEYVLSFRSGSTRENDLSFGLRVQLLTY